MNITVIVTPHARQERVRLVREGYYTASVKAKPVGGEANAALIKLLARYFGVRQAQVRIVLGKTSREKLIKIAE